MTSNRINQDSAYERGVEEAAAEPEIPKTRPILPVETKTLKRLAVRPKLWEYFSRLWNHRHFIFADAQAKAFRENRDYRLGMAWVLIDPFLNAAMYGVIFGLLLQTSRGIDNFLGYLIIGVTFFGFVNRLMMGGSGLVQSQRNMIQSFRFPRVAIVISQSAYRFIEFLPAAIVTIIVAIAMDFREAISWTIVLAVPLFVMLHLFGTGMMFLTARITAFIPDAKAVLTFVSRAWFYLSGVFYAADRFDHVPILESIIFWNPAYQFLNALRDSIIYATVPALDVWFYLILCTVGALGVGFIFFWHAEHRYAKIF